MKVLATDAVPLIPGAILSVTPKLRSPLDRLRQVLLFELGGLILITPPFTLASGVPWRDSLGLLAVLSLIASLWNATYNTGFDWVDGRLSGRTADQRPFRLRCLHALGFELGMFLMSWPIVVYWTGMSWLEAALADILLAVTYTLYALLFNLAYDRLFPIQPRGSKKMGADEAPLAVERSP